MPTELLQKHDVDVARANPWQQRARLMQALWREERAYPAGIRGGPGPLANTELGSRLAMPGAREQLWNYLTPEIGWQVVDAVEGRRGDGSAISEPRIWQDLLSSQPLCFNLFAELAADLPLATEVLGRLWPERIREVTRIRFEYSPGRGDPLYLDSKTAADVFIEHTTPGGGRSFIAIEVKYHEDMSGTSARHRDRFDVVADQADVFQPDAYEMLRRLPLQQMWLDHLLALAIAQRHPELALPLWVFAYPAGNAKCQRAAVLYAATLKESSTFQACTLERIVEALTETVRSDWPRELHHRYLDTARLPAA